MQTLREMIDAMDLNEEYVQPIGEVKQKVVQAHENVLDCLELIDGHPDPRVKKAFSELMNARECLSKCRGYLIADDFEV